MNKDVIYIEPEDDITDIINRLKSSPQKVVALVPPKKLGVLRSAVNNKLIAKSAKESDKVAVIVTTDAALLKMAATSGLPVAKTLQSRPIMPGEVMPEDDKPKNEEEIIEEGDADKNAADSKDAKKGSAKADAKKEADMELNSKQIDDEADKDKDKKDKKKSAKDKNKKIPAFEKYRKWIIIGAIAGVLLIAFLVWAFIFAPAAKIIVSIKTTPGNFSENVNFTTNQAAAKPAEGVFLLEEQKAVQESSVEFSATGQKDMGEKASGTLQVEYRFRDEGAISVAPGTAFSYGGLRYLSTTSATLSWDGVNDAGCEDGSSIKNGCRKTAAIQIQAEASGDKYNISAGESGWSSTAGVSAYNPTAIAGGTTKVVTIVQQSDVDKAAQQLQEKTEGSDVKAELMKKLSKDVYPIESSFKTDVSGAVSTPAVGQEVADGQKAKLTSTTTSVVYGVDQSAIKSYIENKTKEGISDDQRIYSVGDPFLERFTDTIGGFTAKLKSTTQTGPKVTEQDIMDKTKGKKVGEAKAIIKDINSGISNVEVEVSYFWVTSIPNDENKITIEMNVEETKS